MHWIDSTDLREWANRRDCQDTLPRLLRKLIRANSNSIRSIRFPSGESILLGGWDGILEVTEPTEYLPAGISLWEFGANKDVKGKADNEYNKRTKNPIGFNPSQSTFVFVTPRLWQKSTTWINEKKSEGIWQDIKVINAEILDEWIEVSPTVGAWLARHIKTFPGGGVQPTDDFWEEWSNGTRLNLIPELLLGGRNNEQNKLTNIAGQPSIIAIRSIARDEALAFIVSCFKSKSDIEEDFFARSIIVDTPEAYRELSVHPKPLILIPRFEDQGVINRAFHHGHTILVPLGADSQILWDSQIVLPPIDRDSFVEALVKSGMKKELAENYSRETARNITILRRQLEFNRSIPSWASSENVKDIIPALLIGRWDENYQNDKEVVEGIFGNSYDQYSSIINRWLYSQDSPFVKIGSTIRLASPLDAWSNASRYLTRNDFEILSDSVIKILSEVNPAFDLKPEERHMASFHGKIPQYSQWINEGILQSLILTSLFGKKLNLDLPVNAEIWVDQIISKILSSNDSIMWKSFEVMLPWLAEASPDAFLSSIEYQLNQEKSPVYSLFEEDPGFLTATSYHTGLLWALESCAWLPVYLSRSSLILAKLAANDPGGSLSNRPDNSLAGIFKPWCYQTLASYDERIQVLKLLCDKEPDIAWLLLIRMLPNPSGDVGLPTHKPRWRLFDVTTEKPITYKEIYDTHSQVVELLISIFDNTEVRQATLIEESANLLPADRDKLLSFIEENISMVEQIEYTSWHTARNILHHHRSHPDAHWAISESDLSRIERLYNTLQPEDEIDKIIWLFNDHWPNFPQGYQYKKVTPEEHEIFIRDQRIKHLASIYHKFGIDEIIKLDEKVIENWILGDTFAYILENESEILKLCDYLNIDTTNHAFVQGFIHRKSLLRNIDWVFDLIKNLQKLDYCNSTIAKILLPIPQSKKLWDFVDSCNESVITEYWTNISPFFRNLSYDIKNIGLRQLINFKRYISAIHVCSLYTDEIPSDLIIEVLQKAGTEKPAEEVRLDGYQVNRLFEALDTRKDFDANKIIKLEWIFLPLLATYGNKRKPKRLHEELTNNPSFFIEVLSWLYKPGDEAMAEAERKDLSDEQIQIKAHHAYDLLNTWKKIPGMDEKGNINSSYLQQWIKKARKLASEFGRVDSADIHIGKLLAQYPEDETKVWPPDEICYIIETINSDIINRNFSSATFNDRGSSTRGSLDGGDIERTKAERFRDLAKEHQNKFPVISRIFGNLAKGYEKDAKINDEEAERRRLEY